MVREMLTQTWEHFGDNGAGMHGYVLERGAEHTPMRKPEGIAWGKVHECFKNASLLALQHELTYVEGYAVGSFPMPNHHAWCVDEYGNVLDNTWRNPGLDYLGIELAPGELLHALRGAAVYGVLETLTRTAMQQKREAA